MRYHHGLMQMILHDKAQIAKAVNATVISLDGAPQGYKDFDSGWPRSSSSTPTV
jgi:glutathione-independent formaldehyde dehydrogenase